MDPRLSVRGIAQHFGERAVLDDVDLDVPAGRVVGHARTERRRRDHPHAHAVRRARAGGGDAESCAGNDFGAVLAIFPFTSPIVMPARIALGDASTAEIVASLVVGLATVLFVVRLGAAIYRRGIVHTGRRLRLGEVLRTA